MRRNTDGTFRNNNKALTVSKRTLFARWLEEEVLRLKIRGLSFDQIADWVVQVGRGQRIPLTALPPDVIFRADFRITAAGCSKACDRALKRTPNMAAETLRRLITERNEQLYLALQPSAQRGDPKSIIAAIRVNELTARLNFLTNESKVITIEKPPKDKDEDVSPESMQACFDMFHAAIDVIVESGGAPELEGIWRPLGEPRALPPTIPLERKEGEEPGKE